MTTSPPSWGAARLKGKNGLLLRELAYDYAAASFEPELCEHLPGICNGVADTLSRWHEPGSLQVLPTLLRGIEATHIPPRKKSYDRTLTA